MRFPRLEPLRNIVLAVGLLAAPGCSRGPRVAIVAADGSTRATVQVEIADTKDSRELGLMYRQHLGENAGMLFVFGSPSKLTFWMKNTLIPLDMVFADQSGRIVAVVERAKPLSEDFISSDALSQYALEVNGGFCARHRVVAGDRFAFLGFEPRARN